MEGNVVLCDIEVTLQQDVRHQGTGVSLNWKCHSFERTFAVFTLTLQDHLLTGQLLKVLDKLFLPRPILLLWVSLVRVGVTILRCHIIVIIGNVITAVIWCCFNERASLENHHQDHLAAEGWKGEGSVQEVFPCGQSAGCCPVIIITMDMMVMVSMMMMVVMMMMVADLGRRPIAARTAHVKAGRRRTS